MKHQRWKKPGIVLGVLAIGVIVVAIILPRLLDLNRYRGLVASQIAKAVGGTVSLGRLSWGLSNGLWVEADGLSIENASAFPGDLRLPRVSARIAISPLLSKKIVLRRLLLDRPDVRLRLAPEPRKPTGHPEPPPAGTKPARIAIPIALERLTVQKGRLRLEDAFSLPGQELVHVFHEVDIQAAPLSPGQAITFDMALRDETPAGLGALKAHGTLRGLTESLNLESPRLTTTASLTSLHADVIKPYLGSNPAIQRLAGSLSLTVRYDGDLSHRHSAEGTLDLAQMTYADPSLWHGELVGAGTTIGFRLRLDQETLTVEELAVKRGALALTARGVVDNPGGRAVIRNAVVASDVGLREAIPLIPWKALGKNSPRLRAVLEDGGRIVIDSAQLPRVNLGEFPPRLEAILPGIDLTARIVGASVRPSPESPKFRDVGATLRLANGVVDVEGLRGQVGSISLPAISARITDLLGEPRVEGTVKGQLRIERTPEEELAALLSRLRLEDVRGVADLDLMFALEAAKPEGTRLQGRIGLRDVTLKTALSPPRLEGLSADHAVTPDVATIANLAATLAVPATGSAPAGRVALQLQGRLDGWRRQPALSLQHFSTSPVSLPMAASLVPWKEVGASAGAVRDILPAGGIVTIEDLVVPRIELARPPTDLTRLIQKAKAVAAFADLAVQLDPKLPRLERMSGRATLEGGVLTATNVRGEAGPWSLPDVTIRVARLEGPPTVSLTAKGVLRAAATRDSQLEKLLQQHGLKNLTGSASLDVRADYDQRRWDDWRVSGSVVLAGVRAETFPQAVVVDNLRGRVTVNRATTLDIVAEEVTALVDGAPVRLSGTLRGLGTPDLAVEGTVYAQGLDLARAREFSPPLRELGLAGTLDMDVKVSLLAASATSARLNGRLATTGLSFRLPAHGLTVTGGDVELALRGAGAEILQMHMQVNEQALAVTGRILNPAEPAITLAVTSPDLNLDRLLPPDKGKPPAPAPSQPDAGQRVAKPGKAELPAIARRMTCQLQVYAEQGKYRALTFRDLRAEAAYDRGVLTRWDLDLGVEDGHVTATGSADLRDPERVQFKVHPQITSLQLKAVAPVLGVTQLPVRGPVSLTGQVQGRTGSTKELLSSLEGTVQAEMGPGTFTRVGRFGKTMAKILSLVNAQGLLSGSILSRLSGEGLPYRTISAQATFDKGSMDLATFALQSDAMTLDANGRVDLLKEQMDMHAQMQVLGIVDKALQFVPLVGRAAGELVSIQLRATGALDDPDIRMAIGKGVKGAITEGGKELRHPLKGITDPLQKGLEKLLGK